MESVTISETGEPAILLDLNDLRIGNILSYKGELVHVTFLSRDIDDEYQDIIGFCKLGKYTDEVSGWNRELCKDLRPVAITDDHLVKLGFHKIDDDFYTKDDLYFRKDGVALQLGSTHYILDDFEPVGSVDYEFLHDIQNLIFALTRNELRF